MSEKEAAVYVVPDTGEQIDLEQYLDEKGRRMTPDGLEIVDSRPMAPPVGYKKQPSMVDHIRELIRSEKLRLAAEEAGHESFEEADDFDVGDDYDPSTPYEADFDPMTDQERAALTSEGRNVEAILGPAPKPSKNDKEAPAEPPAAPGQGDAQ